MHKENELYNKIVILSRNKFFYTDLYFNDTFTNRIHLIFLHISFLLVIDKKSLNEQKKMFNQKLFDFTFKKIEENYRELGFGDVSVNKNMKKLVKNFYNILLNCENYKNKNFDEKCSFLFTYLEVKKHKKNTNNLALIDYFDKYQVFCLDLSLDNVLKGNLNFSYK